ncbi:MAG: dihydropteroate synthase, partial [Nitrosarchaeum sp.]|nr:dihydropteroate synthase [Nitrosarchaeum sp.]
MTKLGNVGVGGKNPVRIMGILNTSPESFYKKSIKTTKQQITNTIKQMEIDGADFIDVGGMSTAPYLSTSVSEKIESQRILNA